MQMTRRPRSSVSWAISFCTWAASSRVGTSTRATGLRGRALVSRAMRGRREGEGLSRAGDGLADDVAAGEGVGDRGLLDGEGLGDAACFQMLDETCGDAEIGE